MCSFNIQEPNSAFVSSRLKVPFLQNLCIQPPKAQYHCGLPRPCYLMLKCINNTTNTLPTMTVHKQR